jgi:hypothetical protein
VLLNDHRNSVGVGGPDLRSKTSPLLKGVLLLEGDAIDRARLGNVGSTCLQMCTGVSKDGEVECRMDSEVNAKGA